MRGFMALMLAVPLVVLGGAAGAEESGVMAMRGKPPDGVRPLNLVLGGTGAGGVGEADGTHAPADFAASRVEEPEGLVRGRPEQFFHWRNNCIRTPGIMPEGALPGGFGSVPRFVERREGEGMRFFEMVWRALREP